MAKGWKCPRCSTTNADGVLRCAACGLIRGGVVVPGSRPESATPARSPIPAPAVPGWPQPGAEALSSAPPAPLWRRLPWGWALTFVLVGGGAIGGLIFNAGRSDTGEINKPGDLTISDLRVGDCYDLKDPTADEVEQVIARPCAEEHQYELFFIGDVPGTTFPDAAAFEGFVGANCLPAFEAFVGRDYADSELDINWLSPTNIGWRLGDRTVQCSVLDPRVERLTGSLKGTSR